MSQNNARATQRAAAQQYYDELEAKAKRRERTRRNTSMIIIGAMVLSVGGPALFFIFS